jgi:hypothetical protein
VKISPYTQFFTLFPMMSFLLTLHEIKNFEPVDMKVKKTSFVRINCFLFKSKIIFVISMVCKLDLDQIGGRKKIHSFVQNLILILTM